MNFLSAFSLIVALLVLPAHLNAEGRDADALDVFHCTFDRKWDADFDQWPDRWVRKTGAEFPRYVNIEIHEDASAAGGHCLSAELDGASIAIASPPIHVMSRFSYEFEAQLKCEGLKHSTCFVSLEFYDHSGNVLETQRETYRTTKGWETIRLGPLEPKDAHTERVVIGLTVLRGNKGDLQGRVSLANVRLSRLPRVDVFTNQPSNVYTNPDDVEIQCELSGIRQRNPNISFQLFDAYNQFVDVGTVPLPGRLIANDRQKSAGTSDGAGQAPDTYEGETKWKPKIPGYGFYRVDVETAKSDSSASDTAVDRSQDVKTIWLAVVPRFEAMPSRGEFGWTLPTGDSPLPFSELSALLPHAGVNWVKLPVWFDAENPHRGNELIRFVDLLGASNIEVVGIIDRPPTISPAHGREVYAPISDLLNESSSPWLASLEPMMTRLALRVRWWQLGRDGDTSFAGIGDLANKLDELRLQLFRFGQDVNLGINWEWNADSMVEGPVSWNFEQLCTETVPTRTQLDQLLSIPVKNSANRWIHVDPPPPLTPEQQFDRTAQTARASEFVQRLLLAKVRGAQRIFISNPFDENGGLMRANGAPGELLLPWRTTSAMLSGAEYIGRMQLPGGSDNCVFLRPDDQVVMAVWNGKPTREKLFLGTDVQLFDIDGRSSKPELEAHEQVVQVGPVPTFVLGLHQAITQWRMAVAFDKTRVPSIFTGSHANALRVQNTFAQGVGGSFKIVIPQQDQSADEPAATTDTRSEVIGTNRKSAWDIEIGQHIFTLASREDTQIPFQIRLKDAHYGKQPVRVDFKVDAEESFEFSAYLQLEVGTDDLDLRVQTHLDKEGTLIVEQFMTNKTNHLADFRCYLFPKGREGNRVKYRRQRMQVYRLGQNVDRKVYRIPNGEPLVGSEMLLQIEELNGPRYFIHNFKVTDKLPPDANPKKGQGGGGGNKDATDDETNEEIEEEEADRESHVAALRER